MEFLANLHPQIVHFPIAILFTYALFELIGVVMKKGFYQKAAYLLLILGVIGAFFAVLTGNQAFASYQYWNNSSKELFEYHQTYANITIWFFTVLLVVRTFLLVKKKFNGIIKYFILLLALFGCFLIYQSAKYGGDLVKKFGVGTDLKINQSQTNE